MSLASESKQSESCVHGRSGAGSDHVMMVNTCVSWVTASLWHAERKRGTERRREEEGGSASTWWVWTGTFQMTPPWPLINLMKMTPPPHTQCMLMAKGETAGCLGHVERAVKEQLSDNSIIQLSERLRQTERGLATMPLFSPGAKWCASSSQEETDTSVTVTHLIWCDYFLKENSLLCHFIQLW